ncbi:MAG: hypothetical protein IJN82_04405 [Clostridia bacterium]|nr:hypothetical protein [Clostridia bacterium]
MSAAGASLAAFAAPKIAQNPARFRLQNFYGADFFVGTAQNAANPDGFASILTQQRGKSARKNRVRMFLLCLCDTARGAIGGKQKNQIKCGFYFWKSRIFSL